MRQQVKKESAQEDAQGVFEQHPMPLHWQD